MTLLIDMLIVISILMLQGIIFTSALVAGVLAVTGIVYVIYPDVRDDIKRLFRPIKNHLCKFLNTISRKIYKLIWKEES